MGAAKSGETPNLQLVGLARLLGKDTADLEALADVPADDLRMLRTQLTEAIYAEGRPQFERVAALSMRLPAKVVAMLATKYLPPVLGARVTEVLDPDKACELVARLPVEYLGDVGEQLDPVNAADTLAKLPADAVVAIATELFARDEFPVMGEFAGMISEDAFVTAVDTFTLEDLAKLAPWLERNDRLTRLAGLVRADRRAALGF